jgi:D-3-phosphoglycerate dehydrogenase / 2-oxoglutarate reductase
MKQRILVTPRSATKSGHPSLAALEGAGFEVVFSRPSILPTEEDLLQYLPGCVGYLAGVERISASVLENAKELKAISRNGTGADAIDLIAAERLGIKVLGAQGANARGVAELAMALLLCISRSLTQSDRSIKAQRWERHQGVELEGRTLGLVGCGQIGRLVTGFALAFGMKIVAYDPFPTWKDAPNGFRYVPFDELSEISDVISLHCPPGPQGRPILDRDTIGGLKRGVIVINTARAGLIDDGAMLEALDSAHVRGIGLDVFDNEPPNDWRLAQHPKAVSSPHIGGYTPESIDRAMYSAVQNLLDALGSRSISDG